MIVLSIGMPRSGTLWRYNFIKALMIASGGVDALELRTRFHLQPFIGGANADMNTLKAKRLAPAMLPALLGNSYVLNSHARPFAFAKSLVRRGSLKAVYGYRDPRDCILSMLEYSQRRLPDYGAGFLKLHSVEDGIKFMRLYLDVWQEWTQLENTLVLRYEDMHADFDAAAQKIIDYLGLNLETAEVERIKGDFLPRQKAKTGEHIHLETGLPHRAQTEFSPEEQEKLNQAFAPYLTRMGYSV